MTSNCQIIEGKFNQAFVFTSNLEEEARAQIKTFLDHEVFAKGKIAIMPDVHAGKGAVIGFTSSLGDKVIPNVIGVDIGCGVKTWNLGPEIIDYTTLDQFIRKQIPSGRKIRKTEFEQLKKVSESKLIAPDYRKFRQEIERICKTQDQDFGRVLLSIGSLGGGNHFIEIDQDDEENVWLTIHSGSRNFGLRIAEYHQGIAKKYCGKMNGLEYLEGKEKDRYIADMYIAQQYATLNRLVIGIVIIEEVFGKKEEKLESVESVHNYISFDDNIIRKGAISAALEQPVVIPFNMAEGIIIGKGQGNHAWNNSAPHGSGRQMSRKKAKKQITMEDFKKSMKGIWTSCLSPATIDESPMAYKSTKEILESLKETVKIEKFLRPLYNFKAAD